MDTLNYRKLRLQREYPLIEPFLGQELLAYHDPYEQSEIFWWHREKTGSSSEVDFITSVGENVVPIEVKSGSTGRLRSLKIFMEEKGVPIGVRVSQLPLSLDDHILSVPLYMIQHIPRIVRDLQLK